HKVLRFDDRIIGRPAESLTDRQPRVILVAACPLRVLEVRRRLLLAGFAPRRVSDIVTFAQRELRIAQRFCAAGKQRVRRGELAEITVLLTARRTVWRTGRNYTGHESESEQHNSRHYRG